MKRMISFAASEGLVRTLDRATVALAAKQPGQKVTRSDTVRVAVLSLAATLQRVANLEPTPVAQPEAV